MLNSLAVVNTLPGNSLDTFIDRVFQMPLLTVEQEHELAVRLQRDNDIQAAEKLITSHLRYVVSVARNYMGYGLQLGDLIQEGTVGLMKAVRRFDPQMGTRLVTFATHWIKAEIHEYILRNWRMVKVATTKAKRKLFFKLRSSTKSMGWMGQSEIERVASELDVSTNDVVEMQGWLGQSEVAVEQPIGSDEESMTVGDTLVDSRFDPMAMLENVDSDDHYRRHLLDAIEQLDDRSRAIIHERWFREEKLTLKELADTYGISAERIRQVEAKALLFIRNYLQEQE